MNAPEWIDWHGGFNPTPISAVVEVRHRDGGIGTNRIAAEAGDWDQGDYKGWTHNGSGYDIVAYRVFERSDAALLADANSWYSATQLDEIARGAA